MKLFRPSTWFQKESATTQAIVLLSEGLTKTPPKNYEQFAKEGYQENVTVFACVSQIALAIGGIDWNAFAVNGAGEESEIENPAHPLVKLLNRPNPYQSQASFFVSEASYNFLAGQTYIEGVGPTLTVPGEPGSKLATPPLEIYCLRPDRMEIIVGKFSPVANYVYTVGTQKTTFDPSRILHRKRFHPTNDFYGLSPIEAGAVPIDTDNSAQKWNLMLLQNSGRPSGIMWIKGSMTKEQREQLNEDLKKFTGPGNAGKVLKLEVAEGAADWKQISLSPNDLDFLPGRGLSKLEICQAFGVPPEIIGDPKNKTYANYQEARKSFYTETILPYLDMLEADLNYWLVPLFGTGLVIHYDKEGIEAIQEDRETVFKRALDWYNAGLVTANEAREEIGMEPVEDAYGDVRMMPFSVTPVDEIMNKPEPAPIPEIDPNNPDSPPPVPDDSGKGQKVLNMTTEPQKEIHWKTIDRTRLRWVNKARPIFNQLVKKDWMEAAKVVKAGKTGRDELMTALNLNREAWEKAIKSVFMNVGGYFAQETFKGLKFDPMLLGMEGKAGEISASLYNSALSAFITTASASKIQSIQGTTLKDVLAVIDSGLQVGASINDIGNQIEARSGMEAYRADRIARTEVIGASNFGSIQGAKATGLSLSKVWIATRDGHTRDAHMEADGQAVDLDDMFLVGGESILFPGAPGGSAKNVIECRCAIAYKLKAA